MSEKLIKPYEISVWENELKESGSGAEVTYDFEEKKLAIIGSDTMTGLNKVYNPVFNKKSNGEKTLTFSLKYKYFDPYTGNDDIINPFVSLLTNERRIKLHYDNEWYEFIVKDHTESSEEYEWVYTCTDAFVSELSKIGYNITFDAELSNNQGTASELAKETVKNTDWRVGYVNSGKQLVAEPVYKATLYSTTNIDIINADKNNYEDIPSAGQSIYVFYSYIKNQNGKYVQFIIWDETKEYTIDDKNVITDTNFRIKTDLVYHNDNNVITFKTKEGNTVITLGQIETRYQVNRLAYNQRTTYDPVMQRTVERFRAGDREIYKYEDSIYSTSDVIVNYVTNGDNFNMLEDGSLQGWNPYVGGAPGDQEYGKTIKKLELVTKPQILSQSLISLDTLSSVEGFLKVQFNGAKTNDYKNLIYNSGFENNVSLIESIAKGQKFVFRWRAKKGDLNQMVAAENLRAIVAKYEQDSPTPYGYYYKRIDPGNIILEFTGTPQRLNNEIKGGHINWSNNTYYIDDMPQTVSTKYVYEDIVNNVPLKYVWDTASKRFVLLDEQHYSNYLPYYYLVAEAQKTVPNSILSDSTQKYGIFLYNTEGTITYFIQEVQLTRFIADADGVNPILIGNVPTATTKLNEYYYLKPSDNTIKEDVKTYATLEALETDLNLSEGEEIIPIYNDNSEKVLSISAAQSNCFNILQTIAETFECWIELDVRHNPDTGYILYDEDGLPKKYINIREYIGNDNYAGFKYGVNLQSVEREINSEEIVTKMIVDQVQSDYAEEGFVSIINASSNNSGESYILNFNYYYNQGLLDRDKAEQDKIKFIEEVGRINSELKTAEEKRRNLANSLTKVGGDRSVYTEMITTAQDNQTLGYEDFKTLTGLGYDEYRAKQTQTTQYEGNYYILTGDTTVQEGKNYYIREGNTFRIDEELEDTSNPQSRGDYEMFLDVTQEQTLLDIVGQLYISSTTINNFSGVLTSIEQEYQSIKKELYGLDDYNVKIWTDRDALDVRHIYVELNDYLPGFFFIVDESRYDSTVNVRFFDISSDAEEIYLHSESIPGTYNFITVNGQGQQIETSTITYDINDNVTKRFKLKSATTVEGVADIIDDLIEEKTDLVRSFENKYSSFIQEGSWSSNDYVDSELYYLDAIQVSNTSAQPVVTYTINVAEISQLEGFELYSFNAGDKTYIEDTEFFGWSNVNVGTEDNRNYVLTPAREEVIISEVEWHLDEPNQNTITVQNYKTRFEDLFQRINATVQTVQYNEATYAKISTLLDANGTLNQNVLLDSLNNISGREYNLTSNGSVVIKDDMILVQNLTNRANHVILNSDGIRISSDGGENYTTVINGQGINIGAVYTGTLNTNEVIIGSRDNPSFRWDKAGISAFRFYDTEEDSLYDLQTFVRFDQYGLYGINNNGDFKVQSINDIKDKAHFAVTWNGFFIKNSYKDGGRVSITSDNDFQITKTVNDNEQEIIKIGMLELRPNNVNGNLYGMRIKGENNTNAFIADSDGNLSVTGTINATDGNFSGSVAVGTGDPYIEIDGANALIGTSNYNDGPSLGWMINADGNAVFNNITARGAIKTAVFEYAEIQSVGGIFLFRPSSTIRSVEWNESDPDDIKVVVDKIALFKENDWCKVSNYTGDGIADNPDVDLNRCYKLTEDIEVNPQKTYYIYDSENNVYVEVEEPTGNPQENDYYEVDVDTILHNNGLLNIYRISSVDSEYPFKITLEGAGAMIGEVIDDIDNLIGGSLTNMGKSDGSSNYGIGINSSDNTVNLPARAISLFETNIHSGQNEDFKVTYDYQGILGTLPTMNTGVDASIYQHMQGTQGIYTNNMYIGNENQYLAFYNDGDDKKLRIQADEIFFKGSDEWINVADAADATQGGHFIFKGNDTKRYRLTEDTEVKDNKTYYTYNDATESYIEVETPEANPSQAHYYEEFISTHSGAGVIQNGESDPAEWGYNTWIGSNGIQLRTGEEAYATLDANGLILNKGGIKAGEPGKDSFVYVSSDSYGEDYSINNTSSDDWKQIVGTRFGIRSDGTLYATGAHIEDSIEAESLRIGQWTTFDHRLKLCAGTYNLSNDTEVQRGKTYFKQNSTNPNVYDIVIPNGGENPNGQNWCELDQTPPDGWENWTVSHREYAEKYFVATEYEDDYENINTGFTEFGSKYYATTDPEVVNGKIYYQRTGSVGSYKYTAIDNPSGSPSQQGWYELQKFFYEKDTDSPQMIIGNKENFAVTVDNTQITFWYDHQKVAFINGDQMQIPRSVMLEEMLIGQKKWSWREHEGNLQLKWIGD